MMRATERRPFVAVAAGQITRQGANDPRTSRGAAAAIDATLKRAPRAAATPHTRLAGSRLIVLRRNRRFHSKINRRAERLASGGRR